MSRAALMARKLPPSVPEDEGHRVKGVCCVSVFTPSVKAERETSGGYGAGAHLFPFRTEKLSPAATMILRETVGK